VFDLRKKILGLVVAAAVAACDDGVGLTPGTATVRGSVETTTEPAPASGGAATSSPSQAPGPEAQTVSVVQVTASGRLDELATASVEADGSFEVSGIPAGRSDLAVVAYAGGGQAVGSVLIHETSRAGGVIVAAPIDYETSVEAGAYAQVRETGETGSSSELALLIQLRGTSAATVAASTAEIDAVAAGYVAASHAMTSTYATIGASLSAAARAEALERAAIQFALDRHAGMSASAAHAAFTGAALAAYASAGASLEQSVIASAAAASTFDAALYARSSARTDLVAQAVRLNLEARERLATELATSGEAALGNAIRVVLAQARLSLALDGLLDLRAIVETTADAAAEAAVDAAVAIVAPGASAAVQAEVRARAEAAADAARLEARLESASTAQAAASAVAGYRAAVRAAVDSMVAAAGTTSVRADVIADLFIAACGSAYIR
jgi:hypothetical protein